MTGGRRIAEESLLLEQSALPAAGLFLDVHQLPVLAGEPIPVDGDQVAALCGTSVVIGPPPAEVLPGIPATHTAACADCQAVIDDVDTPSVLVEDGEPVAPAYLRRTGTVLVHVIELAAAEVLPAVLIARCGVTFHPGDPVDRVEFGDGVPCTRCLLRSSSSLLGRSGACLAEAPENDTTHHPDPARGANDECPTPARPTPPALSRIRPVRGSAARPRRDRRPRQRERPRRPSSAVGRRPPTRPLHRSHWTSRWGRARLRPSPG
ncbi:MULTISPECIES: hypothetical protein [Actinoalloteichus]|uniref:hypothetical protein n=1 Tax=Actinoalloteichus TaxID=65496 RepID=UPI000952984D|nr:MULTISPECIES: hypothetical protein [Actinoalloteichus]